MNKENNTIVFILIAVLLFLLLGGFGMMSFGGYGGYGMMGGYYGGFGGMWIFGWIFMAAILIVTILAIVWLAQQIQKGGGK